MIRASIVGATGYTGGELLRYLVRHRDVAITHATSESYIGKPVSAIHKHLKGRCDLICEKYNASRIAQDSDVVFLGLPHGTAAKTAVELIQKGTRVIDLSADFRLDDEKVYAQWYGQHPTPKILKDAVYGLPERHRHQLRDARLVANPGCYATTSILAGLPLFAQGLLGKGPIIVDAKSGISGAGRKTESLYLYAEANESIQAYGLKGHRHHPEILQEWLRASRSKSKPEFIFVPQLAPMTRGIFACLYAPLKKRMAADQLHRIYTDFYRNEPFITVLAPMESPEIKAVTYTNACHIGVAISASGTQAIIMAALDNLVKGASGQAIQNMNIMFGVEEMEGLR